MQAGQDFWVYINIIIKRLWLIVLMFLVTEGVIFALAETAEPVYRANVRLQVLAADSSDVALFTTVKSTNSIAEIQQAQNDFMRALKHGFVAWQTIADLNLEIGANDLLAGLSTAVEGDFVIVTIESDDPGRAEAIAMTQVNNALEYFREVRATPSQVLREFVAEELAEEKGNVEAAEAAMLAFKQRNNLDSIERETFSLQDMLRTLKLERDRMLIEEQKAAVYAKSYRDQQADAVAKMEAASEVSDEGEMVSPNTRAYYESISRQHEATALKYEADRDGLSAGVALYDKMIQQRTQELQDVLGLYDEYSALSQDMSRAQANYGWLMDKDNEARLKQLQAEKLGYIQITEPARKPDAPVQSKTLQLLAVGGVVSVLAGFVLAFFIEFLGSVREAARKQRVS